MQMRRGQTRKVSYQSGLREEKAKEWEYSMEGGQGISMNGFYIKRNLRKRPLLPRLTSYSRYSSDTTSITPGFKNKTECITICMKLDPGIHIYV